MSLLDFSPKEQVSDTLNEPQTTTDLLEGTVPSTHHLVLRRTDRWGRGMVQRTLVLQAAFLGLEALRMLLWFQLTGHGSNLVQIPTDLAANSGCPFLVLQQASLQYR